MAPEPWPLADDAQAAVQVTVSRLVARNNGTLRLTGQYAISSYDKVVRERIQGFDIVVPMVGEGPQAIARATGAAVTQLSGQITQSLR